MQSYDRLAFLGDVVLSVAVSTHIYPRFPEYGAGELTKLRAQAVSRQACAAVAVGIGVPERLRAATPDGLGHSAQTLLASDRILASVCESAIGAAYLHNGFERTSEAVVEAFAGQIEEALSSPVDFKSLLQERLARDARIVSYEIEREEGPPHRRSFTAAAMVEDEVLGRGEGNTKKAAEQEAAARVLDAMGEM